MPTTWATSGPTSRRGGSSPRSSPPIRAGRAPSALPGSAGAAARSTGDLEVPYLAAWQAVELVAERHGEAALRRLVAAGSSTGSDADAEAATDRALVSELGTTRDELTRQWLARLGRLGATG